MTGPQGTYIPISALAGPQGQQQQREPRNDRPKRKSRELKQENQMLRESIANLYGDLTRISKERESGLHELEENLREENRRLKEENKKTH